MSLSCGVFVPREGTEALDWTVLTVVDLSGKPKVFWALHTLRSAIEYVDFESQPPIGEKGALERHLACLPALPSLIVLVLSEHSADVAIEVREILRVLYAPGKLWVVAVVSENPDQWSELTRVHGFIKAAEGRLGIDAAQVTLHLTSVFAPETLICVDPADWCEALGTANEPSTLSRAFLQEDNGRWTFTFLTRVERKTVETASAISVMPLYPITRVRQTRDVMTALVKVIRDDCTCILSAPCELIREHAALAGPHKSLLFLCRPGYT